MPTGYTAPITEDENFTFEQYVWRCARQFGALILMRDDPLNAPVPERFEPSNYYAERAAEEEARLERLLAMNATQAASAAEADYQKRLADRERTIARFAGENARYDAMREKVLAWEPPSLDHQGLKDFMLQQIDASKWDYTPEMPARLNGPDWWEREIAEARRTLERMHSEHAKEVQRTNERNAWVEALRQSVPPAASRA